MRRKAGAPHQTHAAEATLAESDESAGDDGAAGEGVSTPYWQLDDEPVGLLRMVRRGPATLRDVLRAAFTAAPAATGVVLVSQAIAGLMSAFGLLATRDVLGDLLTAVPTAARISAALPGIGILISVYALRGALETAAAFGGTRIGPAVRRQGEEKLIRAAVSTELTAYDDGAFYDRLHWARERGLPQLEQATANLVIVLGAVLSLLGAVGAIGAMHPLLAPVLLVGLAPQAWAVLRGAQLHYHGMITTIGLDRRVQMLVDLACDRDAAAELRANQNENLLLDRYRAVGDDLRAADIRIGSNVAWAQAIGRAAAAVGLGATFAALLLLVDIGWVPLATAGAAAVAIRSARTALAQLVHSGNQLLEQGLYVADYQGFLAEAHRRAPRGGARAVPAAPAEITLRDVTFRYPGSAGRPALDGVNLTVRRGEAIALVGLNGSGKTTLAKLIAGLYRPESGTVCWDGVRVTQFDREQLLARVSTTFQTPVHWPDDARTNVRTGRANRVDPDDAALRRAARLARADEVVDDLPHGWATLLSSQFHGGRDLSVGQWQRLAIARGLFRDAPLLIWDEPTAPLDPQAEFDVYESLRAIAAGRTSILITHRLASVRHADRIVLLHAGRIAEVGTHEQLLATGGRYATLYHLQQKIHNGDLQSSLASDHPSR